MFNESGLSGEGFVTQTASMRLLSCVNSLMINEPRLLDEAFSTFIANVGFLSGVSFLMSE